MPLPLILNQTHYVDDLIEQIQHPDTTDVWLQAMVFSPRGDKLKQLMAAFYELLKRGGTATIITDYYNHLRPEDHEPNKHLHDPYYLQEVKNIFDSYRDTVTEFRAAGGTWIETNIEKTITKVVDVWGRNHMKSAGIARSTGEKFTYLGGCNIYPHAMDFIDFMVRFSEDEIYDKVKFITDLVIQGKPLTDAGMPCTDEFTVYVDGGRFPGQSIIYKTAQQLITDKDVAALYLTSQLPLDPFMERTVERVAKRGVKAHIFIPNPEQTNMLNSGIGKRFYQRMVAAEKKIPSYYLYRAVDKKVHAKLLVIEKASGEIQAFWGSNNYFALGQMLCTQEIQVRSFHQEFNQLLRDFFWNLVEGAA